MVVECSTNGKKARLRLVILLSLARSLGSSRPEISVGGNLCGPG